MTAGSDIDRGSNSDPNCVILLAEERLLPFEYMLKNAIKVCGEVPSTQPGGGLGGDSHIARWEGFQFQGYRRHAITAVCDEFVI